MYVSPIFPAGLTNLPFLTCRGYAQCKRKIVVCQYLIFPAAKENDEFVLCPSNVAIFPTPIGVQILRSRPNKKKDIIL